VNFDETTKDFSDRLLDRTNVIIPKKLTFKESLRILNEQKELNDEIEPFNIHTSMYRKDWIKENPKSLSLFTFTETEIELLDELHKLLHEDDRQKGVSFRVALGIANFITNIPGTVENELLISRPKAFDIQLSQRVLPKINGLSSYVQPLVGSFEEGEYFPGSITELLQSGKGKQISNFSLSIDYIKKKAKELNIYGYAK